MKKILFFTGAALMATSCAIVEKIKLQNGSTLSVQKENVTCEFNQIFYSYTCSAGGLATYPSGKTYHWHQSGLCFTEYGSNLADPYKQEKVGDRNTINPALNPETVELCEFVLRSGYNYTKSN